MKLTKNSNGLLLIPIILEIFVTLYHIVNKRIIAGHDGLIYYLSTHYYFLNNVVTTGEIPQWIPYISHGTSTFTYYAWQANLLQNVLLMTGKLLNGINFLTIFHTGILIDKLVLVIGVWLLTKHYFSSPLTRLFVCVTVIGSCVWMYQPGFNFHFYYAVPLILHFIHSFLQSKKWSYAFLAGNLFALQILGNGIYYFPVTSLIIFLYVLFFCLFNREKIQFRAVRFDRSTLFSLAAVSLTFLAVYLVITHDKNLTALYPLDRNADGGVPLTSFMNYRVIKDPRIWTEMISGLIWNFDITLYMGVITLPLIMIGISLNTNRRNIHLICLMAVLFFFSRGTFISAFFYYVWPFMKYFRHLTNVAVYIKLFFCFIAGFGLEYILSHKGEKKSLIYSRITIIVMASMIGISLSLFQLSFSENFINNFSIFEYEAELWPVKQDVKIWLIKSSAYALLGALLFSIITYPPLKKFQSSLMVLIIFFHVFNLYDYKLNMIHLQSRALDTKTSEIFNFQNIPFHKNRVYQTQRANPRESLLSKLPEKRLHYVTDALFFNDKIEHEWRTDQWPRPLDQFMRAYWGQSIDDRSIKPKGLKRARLSFPMEHPAVPRLSGVTEEKIQFFSDAFLVGDNNLLVSNLTNPRYKGDILFVQATEKTSASNDQASQWSENMDITGNHRLFIPYKVTRFESNHLEISADLPGKRPAWMFYSESWHPGWKATVNGQITPVLKANLAYKAVKLHPGPNKIHLFFHSRKLTFLQYMIGFNSLFWIGMLIWLTIKTCLNNNENQYS